MLCVPFFWQALASTLDEAEISDLRDQFDAIDVDKNGVISLEEMRQVSEQICFKCNINHVYLY